MDLLLLPDYLTIFFGIPAFLPDLETMPCLNLSVHHPLPPIPTVQWCSWRDIQGAGSDVTHCAIHCQHCAQTCCVLSPCKFTNPFFISLFKSSSPDAVRPALGSPRHTEGGRGSRRAGICLRSHRQSFWIDPVPPSSPEALQGP